MTATGALGVVARRWAILLVGLLCTAGLSWAATIVLPPVYTARGLVLLIPAPEVNADGKRQNPFLNLGNLELPAQVVIAYFASTSTQAEIAKHAPGAEVTVSLEESTRGPIIAIDTLDSTPEGAMNALTYAAQAIPAQLTHLQAQLGAPSNTTISSMPFTMDTTATMDASKTLRAVIAAVGLGLALTTIVAFALDGILIRRSAARAARNQRAEHPENVNPLGTDAEDTLARKTQGHRAWLDEAAADPPTVDPQSDDMAQPASQRASKARPVVSSGRARERGHRGEPTSGLGR